jgi:type IV pilus assembly protein PilB
VRELPRDRFIETGDASLEVGRSVPPTNAVSEILNHAGVNASHKELVIGAGVGYIAAILA